VSSFIKIDSVVLPLWVVEKRPFPLLWVLAYTTACTTVQAVIVIHFRYYFNKCIGHDTKAAARQSLNCIKNKTKNNKLWAPVKLT